MLEKKMLLLTILVADKRFNQSCVIHDQTWVIVFVFSLHTLFTFPLSWTIDKFNQWNSIIKWKDLFFVVQTEEGIYVVIRVTEFSEGFRTLV